MKRKYRHQQSLFFFSSNTIFETLPEHLTVRISWNSILALANWSQGNLHKATTLCKKASPEKSSRFSKHTAILVRKPKNKPLQTSHRITDPIMVYLTTQLQLNWIEEIVLPSLCNNLIMTVSVFTCYTSFYIHIHLKWKGSIYFLASLNWTMISNPAQFI